MSSPNSSIVEKLQKLIAHEKSAREINSIAEADAFAERIQALMSEHKLTITEVEAMQEEVEGLKEETVSPGDYGLYGKANGNQIFPWLYKLARTIAKCNDCEVLIMMEWDFSKRVKPGEKPAQKPTNKYVFVGVESDKAAAVEMFKYMASIAWEMATKSNAANREKMRAAIIAAKGDCQPGHLSSAGHHWRHSFCQGFSQVVCERFRAQREAMIAKAKAQVQSTALVLVDRRAVLLKDFMRKASGLQNSAPYRAGGLDTAAIEGARAGAKIALTSKTVK